jgi:hypothetical protein
LKVKSNTIIENVPGFNNLIEMHCNPIRKIEMDDKLGELVSLYGVPNEYENTLHNRNVNFMVLSISDLDGEIIKIKHSHEQKQLDINVFKDKLVLFIGFLVKWDERKGMYV